MGIHGLSPDLGARPLGGTCPPTECPCVNVASRHLRPFQLPHTPDAQAMPCR
jgi:hypothetical protein